MRHWWRHSKILIPVEEARMNDKKMLALSGDLRQFHVGDTITISGPSSFVWWKPWTWKRQKPKQFKIKEVYVHENVVELE